MLMAISPAKVPINKIRKRWPGRVELLSWYIWHRIQEATVADLDDPDHLQHWFREFDRLSLIGVHRLLYSKYHNFRIEYVTPHYAGFVDDRQSSS